MDIVMHDVQEHSSQCGNEGQSSWLYRYGQLKIVVPNITREACFMHIMK